MKRLIRIEQDFILLIIFIGISLLLVICASWIVNAETVTTQVTVGNSFPTFSDGPAENPASYSSSPTNAGSNVTFQATATDSNGEDYYLAICKTNSVTAVNGSAPTCGGGNWCITTATDSGTQATCSYTTQSGDAESNAWFAFVCDGNPSAAACSPNSQGSGDSMSPFKVNHVPSYTVIVDNGGGGTDSGANPGGTMTFTATASDADTDGSPDTVKLVVCADNTGATAAGCSGTQICTSSNVASNPSCNLGIASVAPDGNNNYYAYVFDSHSFASTSNPRSGLYVINNVAPNVTGVTLNGGLEIELSVPGSTTNVVVNTTLEDNNSCQDVSTVETGLYRSAITYTGCDIDAEDNNNHCYAQVSCSVSGGSCTGPGDATADYTCTVAVQYHADPTVADTLFPAQNWLATVKAIDNNSAFEAQEVAAGVEMETFNGREITASIDYGSLSVGQKNDPLNQTTTITAKGNIGFDQELSGTAMTNGGSGTIAVGYQKYALAVSTAYASGTTLSGTPTESELNCPKTTVTASPQSKSTWWGIEIPTGIPPGVYSGNDTVTAILGDTANW